jgi:GTPase SAR1 family protein
MSSREASSPKSSEQFILCFVWRLTGVGSEPTVFENYVHDIYVEDQAVELSLWDTAGEQIHRSCLYMFSVISNIRRAH